MAKAIVATPQASEVVEGIARLATQAEVDIGMLGNTIVTPLTLESKPRPISSIDTLQVELDSKESSANKGVPEGYAPLGLDNKVPSEYLNFAGLELQGSWDAATNTPTLGDGGVGGVQGDYFIVTIAGSTSIDGNDGWTVGDYIVNNGTVWNRVPVYVPTATETIEGVIRIGTQQEVDESTLDNVVVTPFSLENNPLLRVRPVLVDNVTTATYELNCEEHRTWDLIVDVSTTISLVNAVEGTNIYLHLQQGSTQAATVNLDTFFFGNVRVPILPYVEGGFVAVQAILISGRWLVTNVWDRLPAIKFVSTATTIQANILLSYGNVLWAIVESDGTVFLYTTLSVTHNVSIGTNTTVNVFCDSDAVTRYTANLNSIYEHSDISNLVNLTYLQLSNNNITDIGIVSNLTKLTSLFIDHNALTNIGVITNLIALEQIKANNNALTSIGTVTNLVNLLVLSVGFNNLTNIGTVTYLTNLTQLFISENNLTNIGNVTNLVNLTHIDIGNNNLDDIGLVTNLTDLLSLSAINNDLNDVGDISNLVNLTYLQLSSNNLTDIGVVTNLTGLVSLFIGNNSLSNIGVITNLLSLTQVQVDNNVLSSVGIVTNLVDLRALSISTNNFDTAELDTLLQDVYNGRLSYTDISPALQIQNNVGSPPSGVYQAQVPPTTGLETVFELENDSAIQGFNKWTVVY